MVEQNKVLKYARRIEEERPETTEDEMRQFLEAKFLHDKDVLASGSPGVMMNPAQFLRDVRKIVTGFGHYLSGDNEDGKEEIVEAVLRQMCFR